MVSPLPLSLCSFPLSVWVLHPPILSTDLPYNVHPLSSSYRYTFSLCVSLSSSSKLYSNRALSCAIGEDSQDQSNGPTFFMLHANWLRDVCESDRSSSHSPAIAPVLQRVRSLTFHVYNSDRLESLFLQSLISLYFLRPLSLARPLSTSLVTIAHTLLRLNTQNIQLSHPPNTTECIIMAGLLSLCTVYFPFFWSVAE